MAGVYFMEERQHKREFVLKVKRLRARDTVNWGQWHVHRVTGLPTNPTTATRKEVRVVELTPTKERHLRTRASLVTGLFGYRAVGLWTGALRRGARVPV
jgi:hypothetical protein